MNLLLSKIIKFLSCHRFLTVVVLLLVLFLSGAGLLTIEWNNSIELMLPQDSEISGMIYFLRDSQLSGKILLSFARDPSTCSLEKLLEITNEFALSLDPNLISNVVKGFNETQVTEDVFFFMQRIPELLGSKDYDVILQKTSEAGIEEALRSKYMQLMRPQGSFFSRLFEQDPLDIQAIIQDKILGLSNSFGYDIQLTQGRLVSSNQLHALMILDTPVLFTNSVQSKILVDYIESEIDALPQGVTADFMCSHTHTVSNQATIQRDIQVTFTIIGFAFLLLFVLYFRDFHAGLIFALPLGAVVLAGNLTAWVIGDVSPIAMGLGSVIIGIAVDYGIHIYIAIRRTQDVYKATAEVMKPLIVGAVTTLSVFAAFLVCKIPVYQHLAWFAFFGILLALFGAMILLPVYIKPRPLVTFEKFSLACSKKKAILYTVIFLILLFVGIWGALGIDFESDISQLDGTTEKYTNQEQSFQSVWGLSQESQAMAVVQDENFEQALEQNDRLYTELRQEIGDNALASLSVIWKSAKERQINADRWNQFWSDERIHQVKAVMAEKAEPFGFSPDAFEPFWEWTKYSFSDQAMPENNTLYNQFYERFVIKRDGIFSLLTLLDDTEENMTILNKLKYEFLNFKVISNRYFSERMTNLYTHELMRVVFAALVLVIVICFSILRDIRMTLISLVPVVAALISILAMVHWMGYSLNVAHLMACIVVIGLCIDYGVFVVYAKNNNLNVGTSTAVTLSAVTTLVGAGSLLFAHHPTLFYVGSTIVIGIIAGYLASMLIVPALCILFPGKRQIV